MHDVFARRDLRQPIGAVPQRVDLDLFVDRVDEPVLGHAVPREQTLSSGAKSASPPVLPA